MTSPLNKGFALRATRFRFVADSRDDTIFLPRWEPYVSEQVIGILGGMGPDATADLYNKIIAETRRRGAARDQDHLEVIISSVPQTPDRTEALLRGGADPVPQLIRSGRGRGIESNSPTGLIPRCPRDGALG